MLYVETDPLLATVDEIELKSILIKRSTKKKSEFPTLQNIFGSFEVQHRYSAKDIIIKIYHN